MSKIKLYNTLTKNYDYFDSIEKNKVKLYTCGPTVYDFLHIGNWAAYIYWDILVRLLEVNGYEVSRVMNITDVGHLVSDADDGEDKLEKGARREGKTAWDIAEFYTNDFLDSMTKLNLKQPTHVTKATDYIEQQLDLIKKLKSKGYTYQINDGIYFDTSKFPSYADFANLNLESQKAGARIRYNDEKRNISDFALWKFTPDGQVRDMQWITPTEILDDKNQTDNQVMGFPGWHLECSTMAMSILGDTLDIHTGGIDHIPVHHTNEIAQSESASGKRFSNFWLHNNHLKVNSTKISKSLGNGYTLNDIKEKGFTPQDLRMFVLQSNYRTEGNFTFENLKASAARLKRWRDIAALRHQTHDVSTDKNDQVIPSYATSSILIEKLSNNLDTPGALSFIDIVFDEIEKSSLKRIDRHALIELLESIEEVLGFDIISSTPDISDDQKQLILERGIARQNKEWGKSDSIRDELSSDGITIRDNSDGSVWSYSQ